MSDAIERRPFNPWNHPPPPREHDPKYQLPGFETGHEADERRGKIVPILPKAGLFTGNLRIRLDECSPGDRCASAACPGCLRRMRRVLVGSGMALLDELHWEPGMGIIACVVPGTQFKAGTLENFDIERESERIRTRFARSSLADQPIFGGWDFSFNEHSEGEWAPFWQPHLYVLMPAVTDIKEAKPVLKDTFAMADTVPRPVRIQALEEPLAAITYSYKAFFQRRITYVADNGRLNTSDRPLRPNQERELRLFLDHIGFTGRLFLRNIRRRGSRLVAEPNARTCRRNQRAKSPKSA